MRRRLNLAPRQGISASTGAPRGPAFGGAALLVVEAILLPGEAARAAVGRAIHALVVGAFAAALFPLALPPPAHAGPGPCVEHPAGIVTCTGDQSAGVSFKSPLTVVLRVVDLSADIAPLGGIPGIKFFSQGANGHNGSSSVGRGDPGGSGANGIGLTTAFSGGRWETVTVGSAAHGTQVYSLGGNGGHGGNALCLKLFGVCVDGPLAGSGGDGGKGGDGGAVSFSSNGAITTNGDNAHGVFVLSHGGDGGRGGDVENPAGYGGGGGKAGSGGQVTISSSSVITTYGASSHGILAQSQGGLGGDGGTGGIVGAGGAGKDAGHGGKIQIENFGSITTQGADSRGIFAQSVGGFDEETGGGGGGSGSGLFVIGGGAGSGGAGGVVTVTNRGSIETQGAGASAILAESIGGGGGSGGASVSLLPTISFAVGGSAGAGGNGGTVTVDSRDGTIDTVGNNAAGIQANSIGGGGGSASAGKEFSVSLSHGGHGGKGGDGGSVTVQSHSTITTQGANAPGIAADSIGGGGGNGGYSVSAAFSLGYSISASWGGTGGAGGNGGEVNVGSNADPIAGGITTLGNFSDGIVAQSTGKGGGRGGVSVAGTAGLKGSLSLSVGGFGGDGGAGGNVSLYSAGDITTEGNDANGIKAQSIGGSGGDGGVSVAGGLAVEGKAINFSVGGFGGGRRQWRICVCRQ